MIDAQRVIAAKLLTSVEQTAKGLSVLWGCDFPIGTRHEALYNEVYSHINSISRLIPYIRTALEIEG